MAPQEYHDEHIPEINVRMLVTDASSKRSNRNASMYYTAADE
jgi:hypothetical protein